MSVEERVLHLEKSFVMLVELARSANERLNSQDRSFDELDVKIAALADAQIKTEDSITRTNEAVTALTSRVDHLTVLVERIINPNDEQ